LLKVLAAEGIATTTFAVAHEPSIETVAQGLSVARVAGAGFVVGFGGGSVIDAAKAVAGLLANPGDPFDHLEIVGSGKPLARPALPWMAIPTTAGTGAEVTRNAVLAVPERKVKVSLRSPYLPARVALVDPELAYDLPEAITAATGMDALTQLIEPYVCARANPMTDALCAEGIPRAAKALAALANNPADTAARRDLALAALWSGMALANAGLGAVHGLAGPIGGRFDAPHGAICAALLAPVMRINIATLSSRAPGSPALARYGEIARRLTGSGDANAEDGVRHIEKLVSTLRVEKLSVYGLRSEHIPELAAQAQSASSMKANPVVLAVEELGLILREAL
jgi:alcohol dehydrogenase class IV